MPGFQVLVCSSYFSKNWARKEFGPSYMSYFLVGTIIKSQRKSKKEASYDVKFEYDNSNYTWKASQLCKFEPAIENCQDPHWNRGYVVKTSKKDKDADQGQVGEKYSKNAISTAIVVFGGTFPLSMI